MIIIIFIIKYGYYFCPIRDLLSYLSQPTYEAAINLLNVLISNVINLFLVCKNDLFFRTIQPILMEHDISIAGVCKSPPDAVEMFAKVEADIILLDANWSTYGFGGGEILSDFLKYDKSLKIIFVTNFFTDKLPEKSKEAGAMGYFYRNVGNPKIIIDCITAVHNGKNWFIKEINPAR